MDVDISKLPIEEREFYKNSENKDDWVKTVFNQYTKPLAIGIGIQNQFIDNVNQTVSQWRSRVKVKKFTSFARFKRNSKHKIYVSLIGQFPSYFYYDGEFNYEFKNCIKMFMEMFFPGRVVDFMPEVDHRDLDIAKRTHEKSKQLQLFLPDVNVYLRRIIPKDALCMCGLSWFDFFPSYELNHILGEGSIENGTAAFTFGHYALFKQKEMLQAGNWKGEYVIEKPLDISDSLGKEKDMKNGQYDYVTEHEKEEAKIFTSECDQEGCAGSKLIKSPAKTAGESNLNLKVLFTQRRSSDVSVISNSSATRASCDCSTGAENVVDEQVILKASDENELNTALPPNTTFKLSCKILRRLFRVISHEICHVLGMSHCQYFSCTMNTSSSVLHTDTQPLLLCPICLRKLQLSSEFRVKERYQRFLEFLLLHTEVCKRPGLHREEMKRVEETQVLTNNDVCVFKNDVQSIVALLEILKEKREDFGFTKVDMEA